MRKVHFFAGAILGLLILLSTGCQDVKNDQLGTLIVKLTDAPFPIDMIDAATVNITKMEIRKKSEGEEEGYPFVTLPVESQGFNLIDLQNGVTADLLEVKIEAGSYDLIRLYVDEVGLSVKGYEDPFNLKVPSGSQTGIKIFIDPAVNVVGGLSTELLLDFSVENSFLLQGNMNTPAGIKGFHFKPVIRAANISTTGSVEGVVVDADDVAMAGVSVRIEQDEVIASTSTEDDGYYSMLAIDPGLYNLIAEIEGFETDTIEDVQIVEGNRTVQNFKLSPAEPAEEE
jgi:hypothetical protein